MYAYAQSTITSTKKRHINIIKIIIIIFNLQDIFNMHTHTYKKEHTYIKDKKKFANIRPKL